MKLTFEEWKPLYIQSKIEKREEAKIQQFKALESKNGIRKVNYNEVKLIRHETGYPLKDVVDLYRICKDVVEVVEELKKIHILHTCSLQWSYDKYLKSGLI